MALPSCILQGSRRPSEMSFRLRLYYVLASTMSSSRAGAEWNHSFGREDRDSRGASTGAHNAHNVQQPCRLPCRVPTCCCMLYNEAVHSFHCLWSTIVSLECKLGIEHESHCSYDLSMRPIDVSPSSMSMLIFGYPSQPNWYAHLTLTLTLICIPSRPSRKL